MYSPGGIVSIAGLAILIFSFFLLSLLKSPSLLLITFLGFVGVSTFMCSLVVSNLTPYMLFLVYVGGLLVLMIYLVLLSSNFRSASFRPVYWLLWLVASCGAWTTTTRVGALSSSTLNMALEYSSLLVLGSLLTFLFLGVCNILGVGGSTLIVGKTS